MAIDHAPGGTCDHGECCAWHCQDCQTEEEWQEYKRRHPGPPRRISPEGRQRAKDTWR